MNLSEGRHVSLGVHFRGVLPNINKKNSNDEFLSQTKCTQHLFFISTQYSYKILYLTVTARSEAWSVLVRSNTGVVASNLIRSIDVSVSSKSTKINSTYVLGNRYSKCYCVASVTKTFILKGVQTIHRSPYEYRLRFVRNCVYKCFVGYKTMRDFWTP
jgi:hypothetical protein